MGWAAMSFPGSSTLTSVEMTAIASNFYSVFNQESGSPPPVGVWSFQGLSVGSFQVNSIQLIHPGSVDLGSLNVRSSFSIAGAPVTGLGAGANSGGNFFASSGYDAPAATVSSLGVTNVASLAVAGNGYPIKAWGVITRAGSLISGMNLVSSKTTITCGNYALTFGVAQPSSLYAAIVTEIGGAGFLPLGSAPGLTAEARSLGAAMFYVQFASTTGQFDPDSYFSVMVMGN